MTTDPVSHLQRRFFDAAMTILATEGYGGLKQSSLVKHLGLTTGAFFHSFASWRDFQERLLAWWHHERTLQVMEVVRDEHDPAVQVESLLTAALGLAHASEAAIRSWGGADRAVRDLVAVVDSERLEIVTTAFLALTGDSVLAARLARMSFYILVGYEQSDAARDPDALEWALRTVQRLALPPATDVPTE